MSSINFYPTFEYSQPDEYRFSHDSVFFARWLFEHVVGKNLRLMNAIDIGAGCGIIALDFLFHLHKEAPESLPQKMDFLEIQNLAYRKHFDANTTAFHRSLSVKTELEWISHNYKNYVSLEKYDLMFSNPPYFFPSEGLLSPNEFKNRCRFFLDASFEDFILCLERNLSPRGQAFFLLRDPSANKGLSALEFLARLPECRLHFSVESEVRGTLIIKAQLHKNEGL